MCPILTALQSERQIGLIDHWCNHEDGRCGGIKQFWRAVLLHQSLQPISRVFVVAVLVRRTGVLWKKNAAAVQRV